MTDLLPAHAPRPDRTMIHFLRCYAAAMVLTVTVACSDELAPPFEATGTGDVAGQLFFDADNNGVYSPLGGDTAVANVEVRLRVRDDTVTIDKDTTDLDGRFSFSEVPLGTHELVVTPGGTPGLIYCSTPARTSVYIAEQTFIRVPGRLGCVISIEEAKDLPQGQSATVTGIVTAAQGTFRNDNAYIQDATGGIQIFNIPSLGLVLGDSVEVTGVLSNFNGEPQIGTQASATLVTSRTAGSTVPAPTVRTAGELDAAVDAGGPQAAEVGRLITVRAATVGAFVGQNADLTDATGTIQLRTDGNVGAGTTPPIPKTIFQAGKCYDITGILGYFNTVIQLKPRRLADVVEVPCP